ncbi:hypothetical protein HID58_022985 [Brassica napus]|uniref:Replication protein A 70 kDa DNA-binding subunit B/D first OB fold domain-containing protein n=1 Tax=Brassica napus TaxID=3708 RepID=A0ABQ8D0U3_BRANA|nr:hypothetical protein HID58_022985 [Brassica napus]
MAMVIRLWKQFSASGGLTIEMVLLDDNGDKIHATVKKDLVQHHQYRIGFLSTTCVKICQELPMALTGLDPVNFRVILDGSLNPDYLVGQVVEVSHMDVISVNGKETPKISLELRNTDNERLPVVLWGKFASDVNEAIQTRGEDSIIYDRSVSNAYNVCDLSLNLDMQEVAHFISLLPKDGHVLAIVKPKNHRADKDDFFVWTPRKTIVELFEAKHLEAYTVMCTIVFKLHIDVIDHTGQSKFMLFDNLAFQLLGKPCAALTGLKTEEDALKDSANPTESTLSNVTEGSLVLCDNSSPPVEIPDLTPAKRKGEPVINLEDAYDQNSVTKLACTIRIKKEKDSKSG